MDALWWMLAYFLREGRGLRDIELVLRRSLAIAPTGDQRDILENVAYRFALMRGRATGLPRPSWSRGAMSNFTRVVDALFLDADLAAAVPAAAVLERQVGTEVTGGCCRERFAAAEAALEGGRIAIARGALADMDRYRFSPETRAPGSGEWRVWPLILAAQLAARDRSPAAADRIRELGSTLVNYNVDWEFSLVYGNLIAARLLEQRGDYAAALAAIRRRDPFWTFPTLVTYHRGEGRIAAEAGDTAGAIRAYQRWLRIRADAEPRLQPQVPGVRGALAGLQRGR